MSRSFMKLFFITAVSAWSLNAQGIATFIHEATQSYRDVEQNILQSAEKMPEGDYAFRPTLKSRTFGQIVRDIADSQSNICSAIDENGPRRDGAYPRSKAELIEALQQSIRTCDSAYASVTPSNADHEAGFGSMRHSKLGLLFLNVARDRELYGQMVIYLRLKGLSPPYQVRVIPAD